MEIVVVVFLGLLALVGLVMIGEILVKVLPRPRWRKVGSSGGSAGGGGWSGIEWGGWGGDGGGGDGGGGGD